MAKILNPIMQNKKFFVLLSAIFFVFFIILDLVMGGVIPNFSSTFSPGIEGSDMIHVLPFITYEYSSNLPLWNTETQSYYPHSYRILFPSGLTSRSLELMYYQPFVIALYLINAIIISLIISYLIIYIYAKIQTSGSK
jgi:hypothetical protein